MKVLFLHDAAVPGGVETRIIAHAIALRARGHEVCAIRKSGPFFEAFAKAGLEQFDFDFFESRRDFAGTVDFLRKTIREQRVDFCDLHPFWALLPGALAAMAEGVPFAINGHASTLPDDRTLQNLLALPMLLQCAAFSTANSSKSQAFLRSLAPDAPGECLIVPNTIDTEAYGSLSSSRLPPRRLAIISRLAPDKRESLHAALRFVEAYAKTSSISLEIRLCGDGALTEELVERLSALQKRVKLKFEYRGACQSSLKEIAWSDAVLGLGRVALEGIAAGRPVVLCGVTGAIAGVVSQEKIGVLFGGNMSGRTCAQVEPEEVAKELLSLERSTLRALSKWAKENVGPERLEPWLEQLEASGNRERSPQEVWAIAVSRFFHELFELGRGVDERDWFRNSLQERSGELLVLKELVQEERSRGAALLAEAHERTLLADARIEELEQRLLETRAEHEQRLLHVHSEHERARLRYEEELRANAAAIASLEQQLDRRSSRLGIALADIYRTARGSHSIPKLREAVGQVASAVRPKTR